MSSKGDITVYEDVDRLVRTFYGKLLADPLMAPHFHGLALEAHLPRITAFWAFILLDIEGYKGNVMDRHRHLAIGPEHFARWVQTFSETVDELYAGPKADLAKQRAKLLGLTFQTKFKS